ncbi:porin [Bergeyella sp. RCAD1439]|uniref:porin n=1 Tax=Bergeyella anatis TaxID=3113737 RepID=UPI002E180EB0|nr:porin [Bergeyella sp. RCAD1439]
MKGRLLFLFVLLCSGMLLAQKKKDTLVLDAEDEIKIESLPYYNFGKGVGMTSPDSLFQMNIRFRMQNRMEVLSENNEVSYEAMIRRLRLRLDGYVGNPKFLYVIQLSFAPKDVGPLEDDGDLNVIRDAMIFYTPNKSWSFGFGQTKLPGNRQRVNSSGALQLTDRSINNAIFNIDRDFGIHAYYLRSQNPYDFGFNIRTTVSTGEGRNWTKTKDNGLAYTGRLEIFPFGAFKKGGEFFEGDLMREETPKLYLGATYHYNQHARRTAGQQGSLLYEPKTMSSLLADALLKYNGWALMSSYMNRRTPGASPIAVNPKNLLESNFVYTGQGYDTQLSYVFPKNWEIIGRFSTLNPHDDVFRFMPKQKQYSLGLTKYLWEHAFKAQLEVSKNDFRYYDGTKRDNWYLRLQIEMGI